MDYRVADFDYLIPQGLIAQQPAINRSSSRLLDFSNGNTLRDSVFSDLPQILRSGDLLIVNDSKVIHARLFGRKESGGACEILIERILAKQLAIAQIRASKAPKPGSALIVAGDTRVHVEKRTGDFYSLHFPVDVLSFIEQHGQLPIPPYISRTPSSDDEERYQTIFANTSGSVAAPTAGLHFDFQILQNLAEKGIGLATITLHVGAGTFRPLRSESLADHHMHSEQWEIPESTVQQIQHTRATGGRIVAVGTTTVRALESAAQTPPLRYGTGETNLFIQPGFHFQIVDLLITNFHLPRSTLLVLVSAFAGIEKIRAAYQHAILREYRFFSYGDAILLARSERTSKEYV